MSDTLKDIQRSLKEAGFYTRDIDGIWGSGSQGALDKAIAAAKVGGKKMQIAWGAKVSPEFLGKVKAIVAALGMPADTGPGNLMTCIAWESGRTFSPSVTNQAGSGATGLIQFMPATAIAYFWSDAQIRAMSDAEKKAKGREACAKLAAMSDLEQLDYVARYFAPYKGKLKNLGDLYSSIIWQRAIGKSDDYVLWDKATRPETYRQNMGLDVNKDGAITRGETLIKLNAMKEEGLKPGNVLSA